MKTASTSYTTETPKKYPTNQQIPSPEPTFCSRENSTWEDHHHICYRQIVYKQEGDLIKLDGMVDKWRVEDDEVAENATDHYKDIVETEETPARCTHPENGHDVPDLCYVADFKHRYKHKLI